MYESPIDIIYNDIQYKVVEELDKNIVSAVQSYGIDVNKEELLKALRYDRQQYEKGYADAKSEQRWIPCSERLPEEYGEYRITWTTSASKKRFIGDSEFELTSEWDAERYRFKGEWLLDEYIKNYPDVKVIAWKPLEEPYEGGEG